MPTRRVLVHIGLPKAASTSLQATLAASRPAFGENGIAYPVLGGGGTKDQRPLRGAIAGDPVDRAATVDGIAQCADAHTLILSGETLSGGDPAGLASILEEGPFAGCGIEAFAIVRDPASWLNSMYAFRAIQFLETAAFPHFVAAALKEGHGDFGATFAKWAATRAAGGTVASFTPLPLRSKIDNRSVITRLAELWDFGPDLLTEEEPRNEAADPRTVEAARRLARRGLKSRDLPTRRKARALLQKAARAYGWAERFSGLNPALTARIASRTRANDLFARTHWGENWNTIYAMPDPARLAPQFAELGERTETEIAEVVESLSEQLALKRQSVFGWLRS
ncbi:hypothetical protein L1787_20320 [Acuticoccus sp. M5D2P5]|uniref:hypothetical protein n=1 Tax=Acuticoccus kalidii TaxID=2910977 RepID=UPI001F1D17FD|nr:hypothetical protein [Acuticoccus kalidii]MCF3935745.1 hypothetical protein [Acuticoccus kalidii]